MQEQVHKHPNRIELRNLTKTYHYQPVLDGVNMTIEAGQFCILVGDNGAGKTTLLRILAGLTRPDNGEVIFGMQHIGATPTLRRRIGYIGHQPMFYQDLTAEENLWHYAHIYQIPQHENKVLHGLQLAGLLQHRNKPIRTFSHGMVQRLSIVRALLHDPSILLLDEPYTGLDQEANQFLDTQLIQFLKHDCTILLAMHQPHHIMDFASHIAWLKDGKISHHLRIAQLFDAPDLQGYLQGSR